MMGGVTMDNQQIAHDLAVAKLYGSELPVDKLVEKYHEYFNEVKDYLNSQSQPNTVQVIQNPFR